MIYKIILSPNALKGIEKYKKAGNYLLLKKVMLILEELAIHPTTGLGKPEQPKGILSDKWSRRIDKNID